MLNDLLRRNLLRRSCKFLGSCDRSFKLSHMARNLHLRVFLMCCLTVLLVSRTGAVGLTLYNEIIQDVYDDRTQVSSRVSLELLEAQVHKKKFTVTPYAEGTYDLHLDTVSKIESGLDTNFYILKDLFIPLSAQYVSVSDETSLVEQYVSVGSGKHELEVLSGLGFVLPLPLKILEFNGQWSYVFDPEERHAVRNELTAALVANILPLDLGLRWRHLDTIHGPDTDEIALTFALVF